MAQGLKDSLVGANGSKLLWGYINPSTNSVPVFPGDLYVSLLTFKVYTKNDNGTTINWTTTDASAFVSDTAYNATTWNGVTTVAPSKNAVRDKFESISTDIAAKQPLDSDLTTIAGLTATTDSFLQSKSSAWTTRTIAQVKTDLGLTGTNSGDQTATTVSNTPAGNISAITVQGAINELDTEKADAAAMTTALAGKQPLDSDLTTIAGLTATTDNFLQAKASAWASRTPTQVKVDLAIDNVNNTSDANKPISTLTQTALDLKSNSAYTSIAINANTALTYATHSDKVLLVTTGAGVPVLTAPASPTTGMNFWAIKVDSGNGAIVFDGNGKNVRDQANFAIRGQFDCALFSYNGTSWDILALIEDGYYQNVTGNVTLNSSYRSVTADTSSTAFTVTLEAYSGHPGRQHLIMNTGTKELTIVVAGGLNIIDEFGTTTTSIVLVRKGDWVVMDADGGTGWRVRSKSACVTGERLIAAKYGANFNVTTDQPMVVNMAGGGYIITRIVAASASISLTTAAGGIYTGAGKTGTAIVAAAQVYSALTASTKYKELTLNAATGTDIFTSGTLYFALTTGQGSAATGNILVYGRPI